MTASSRLKHILNVPSPESKPSTTDSLNDSAQGPYPATVTSPRSADAASSFLMKMLNVVPPNNVSSTEHMAGSTQSQLVGPQSSVPLSASSETSGPNLMSILFPSSTSPMPLTKTASDTQVERTESGGQVDQNKGLLLIPSQGPPAPALEGSPAVPL